MSKQGAGQPPILDGRMPVDPRLRKDDGHEKELSGKLGDCHVAFGSFAMSGELVQGGAGGLPRRLLVLPAPQVEEDCSGAGGCRGTVTPPPLVLPGRRGPSFVP
jgi:hypothetical protein